MHEVYVGWTPFLLFVVFRFRACSHIDREMADKYNSNGDYSNYGADFKRKNTPTRTQEDSDTGNEDNNPQQQKANEYIRELLAEKTMLDESKYPHAFRLIEQGR